MNRAPKMMIRILAVIAIAVAAGCGGGSDTSGTGGDAALAGGWTLTSMAINNSASFDPGTIGWSLQLQINASGGCTGTEVWQGETDRASGSWTVTGDQLHITIGEYNWTGKYSVGSTTFSLTDVPDYDGQGHSGSFVFTRQ